MRHLADKVEFSDNGDLSAQISDHQQLMAIRIMRSFFYRDIKFSLRNKIAIAKCCTRFQKHKKKIASLDIYS